MRVCRAAASLRVAELAACAPWPPVVRFRPGPAERRAVSAEDLAAAAAEQSVPGRRRGLTQDGDPAGLPRCGRRSPTISRRRAASSPNRARSSSLSGAQEGIAIAARLFLTRGTLGAIENPCYQGAALAFEAAGRRIAERRGRRRRDRPRRLAAAPAALLYSRPSHQYPTGHTLSARAPRADRRLGAPLRLLHPRGRSRRRLPLRGSPLPASRRMRPTARSMSARSPVARRRIAARLHGGAGALAEAVAARKRC